MDDHTYHTMFVQLGCIIRKEHCAYEPHEIKKVIQIVKRLKIYFKGVLQGQTIPKDFRALTQKHIGDSDLMIKQLNLLLETALLLEKANLVVSEHPVFRTEKEYRQRNGRITLMIGDVRKMIRRLKDKNPYLPLLNEVLRSLQANVERNEDLINELHRVPLR